jgi:hypothetical protein
MGSPVRPTPQEKDRAHTQLVAALTETLRTADRGGPDFAGSLSAALQDVARARGGPCSLVESRPGSWEAVHVHGLAGGSEFDWDN